jgi:hypothetical protein
MIELDFPRTTLSSHVQIECSFHDLATTLYSLSPLLCSIFDILRLLSPSPTQKLKLLDHFLQVSTRLEVSFSR